MGLVDKFNAVTIDPVSLITDHDRAVCEEMEQKFRAFVEFAAGYNEFIDMYGVECEYAEYDYSKPKRLIEDMDKQIQWVTKRFISSVCGHFQRTYNVTIQSESIRVKHDHTVTYQDIVDDIIVQLDGMNFAEKAVDEIKQKLHKLAYNRYRDTQCSSVKGCKVTFDDMLWFESSWGGNGKYRLGSGSTESARDLFVALSHFETGSTKMLMCFAGLCKDWDDRSDWFDTHTFDWLNKVVSTKFYKNHKVEVKFVSAALAQQFAREYMGV